MERHDQCFISMHFDRFCLHKAGVPQEGGNAWPSLLEGKRDEKSKLTALIAWFMENHKMMKSGTSLVV